MLVTGCQDPIPILSFFFWEMSYLFASLPLILVFYWSYVQIAGNQAILTLDILGFSYCHIECQNFIQIQLKIQTKL